MSKMDITNKMLNQRGIYPDVYNEKEKYIQISDKLTASQNKFLKDVGFRKDLDWEKMDKHSIRYKLIGSRNLKVERISKDEDNYAID